MSSFTILNKVKQDQDYEGRDVGNFAVVITQSFETSKDDNGDDKDENNDHGVDYDNAWEPLKMLWFQFKMCFFLIVTVFMRLSLAPLQDHPAVLLH
jgi:hypothetical protein